VILQEDFKLRSSIGLLALSVLLAGSASAVSAQEIAWKRSYQEGRLQGQKTGKPLAVFIGAGSTPEKAIPEGTLGSAIRKILADHYVCVHLDAARDDQQRLLRELGIRSDRGLVLSDRTGDLQAYSCDGPMSDSDLERQLRTFADPAVVIRTTLTGNAPSVTPANPLQRVSYYPSAQEEYRPAPAVSNYLPAFRPAPAAANC
jgi:hypothetical protein